MTRWKSDSDVAGDLLTGLGGLSTTLAGEMVDDVDRFVVKEGLMPNPRGLALFISSRRAE